MLSRGFIYRILSISSNLDSRNFVLVKQYSPGMSSMASNSRGEIAIGRAFICHHTLNLGERPKHKLVPIALLQGWCLGPMS